MAMQDRLDLMFQKQAKLFEYVKIQHDLNYSYDEWIVRHIDAMINELEELRNEVNWKWWKAPMKVDKAKVNGEIIDLWFFLTEMSIVAGITPKDITKLYDEKYQENIRRQEGTSDKKGYQAIKSEPIAELREKHSTYGIQLGDELIGTTTKLTHKLKQVIYVPEVASAYRIWRISAKKRLYYIEPITAEQIIELESRRY